MGRLFGMWSMMVPSSFDQLLLLFFGFGLEVQG